MHIMLITFLFSIQKPAFGSVDVWTKPTGLELQPAMNPNLKLVQQPNLVEILDHLMGITSIRFRIQVFAFYRICFALGRFFVFPDRIRPNNSNGRQERMNTEHELKIDLDFVPESVPNGTALSDYNLGTDWAPPFDPDHGNRLLLLRVGVPKAELDPDADHEGSLILVSLSLSSGRRMWSCGRSRSIWILDCAETFFLTLLKCRGSWRGFGGCSSRAVRWASTRRGIDTSPEARRSMESVRFLSLPWGDDMVKPLLRCKGSKNLNLGSMSDPFLSVSSFSLRSTD